MRSLLAALLATAVLSTAPALAQGGKCRIVKIVDWPVTYVRGHIVVSGAINGQKVGIILDTGAMRSIIMRPTAQRLKLTLWEVRGARMYGVGGETALHIATVDDFKLGETAIPDIRLYVAGEQDFGEGKDVLLGEDFLRNFDIEFDLANRAVRLFQPQGCDGVSLAYWTKEVPGQVEIERIDEERPRIAFPVQVNGRPVEAFLDSGAPTSIVSIDDAAAVGVTPTSAGVAAGPMVGGVGGKRVEIWSGPFESFAVGNETIRDIRIRFGDLDKYSTATATGSRIARRFRNTQPMMLGADFLQAHRLLVSHSQRRLYYTYVGGPVFSAEPAPVK